MALGIVFTCVFPSAMYRALYGRNVRFAEGEKGSGIVKKRASLKLTTPVASGSGYI